MGRRAVRSRAGVVDAKQRACSTRVVRQAGLGAVDTRLILTCSIPTDGRPMRARSALGVTGGPVLGLIAQIMPWDGHTRVVDVLARLTTLKHSC